MGERISLDLGWRFSEDFRPEYARTDFKDNAFRVADIPHCIKTVPSGYFGDRDYQGIVCYRKMFILPDEMFGQKLLLHFDGVMCCAAVLVNGKPVCAHKGGFTPFECEVTGLLKKGDNLITVVVDSNERQDTAPNVRSYDHHFFGGIYRQVWLESVSEKRITSLNISSRREEPRYRLFFSGSLSCADEENITFFVYDGDKKLTAKTYALSGQDFSFEWLLPCEVEEWSLSSPKLYTIRAAIGSGDEKEYSFGFRSAEFRYEGFFLNGERITVIGTARGQEYLGCGYSMPKEMQSYDAKLIKSLGFNCVRTFHSPPDEAFLDECDRIGLMVVDEAPGWRAIGDEGWQANQLETITDLIKRDRVHSCVIAWSVRPEGAQDSDFFSKCSELARSLDPARPLLGFRSYPAGEIDEDVYVYTDSSFGEKGVLEKRRAICRQKMPYMVNIGFSGHFELRRTYGETAQLSAALLFARALDQVSGDPEICGGFFGCLSDYHVHEQLGGGDCTACYGLTDLARTRKLTSAVFESQQEEHPVLELSSLPLGDFYPAAGTRRMFLFTNCDRIKIYRGKDRLAVFSPSSKMFPHLKHPPFTIDDLIGEALMTAEHIEPKECEAFKQLLVTIARERDRITPELRVKISLVATRNGLTPEDIFALSDKYIGRRFDDECYHIKGIKDGKTVRRIKLEPARRRILIASPASAEITQKETYGCTRLEICAVDQNGTLLRFCNDAVSIETEGSLDVIGPRTVSLSAGRAAVFLRTKGGKGVAKVIISADYLEKCVVELEVGRANTIH